MAIQLRDQGLGRVAATVPTLPERAGRENGGRLMSTAAEIAQPLGDRGGGPRWSASRPAPDDRSPRLSIGIADEGRILLHCFSGCPFPSIVTGLRRDHGLLLGDGRDRFRRRDRRMPDRLPPMPPPRIGTADDDPGLRMTLWRETVDLPDSPGETYLRSRLHSIPGDLPDLRHHRACPRGPARLPALVGSMRNAVTNEPTGIHRTFHA